MLSARELEAQAKALAPVMAGIVSRVRDDLRKEFAEQLSSRDRHIERLEKALADKVIPSVEDVVSMIDLAALAKSAAELVPPAEKGADADMNALMKHLEGLVAEIPAPENGKSVSAEDVAPMIREEVEKAVAELPPAKGGESVTLEDVQPLLAELVSDAVKALPAAEPGNDADMDALRVHLKELVDAIPPAKDGKSVSVEDVLPLLKEHADSFLKSLPVPKDGEPGKDGVAPTAEEIAATFERRFSDLALSWERQARDTFDKAADRMPIPKDGENGRDALPLESFDIQLGEDGRTLTVKMQAGEILIEKSVKLPTVIDRGVYSAEKAYEQGDGTTYGGCYWIAQKDDPEGVPGGSSDWRLAVKKGRDGKDLRDNASKHDPSKGVRIRKKDDDDDDA